MKEFEKVIKEDFMKSGLSFLVSYLSLCMFECDDAMRESLTNALEPMRKIIDCMEAVDKSKDSFKFEDDGNGGLKKVPTETEDEYDNSFVEIESKHYPLTVRLLYGWAKNHGDLDLPIKFLHQNGDYVEAHNAHREVDCVVLRK